MIGKKGIILLSVLCCIIFNLALSLPDNEAILVINPESQTVQQNTNFTLQVNISGNGIYGVQFDLYFNSTILDVINVTEENFFKQNCTTYSISQINNTAGKITFADTCTGDNGVNGAGILCNITFKAKSEGLSSFNFYNVKIIDSELQQLYVSFNNGTVDVIDCDLNQDGILIHDWEDLMVAYKCFLGVNKNCGKIDYQYWNLMKQEYGCFTGN